MRVGVDASNLRAGGGVTHLIEFLQAACPDKHGVKQIIVWGGDATLTRIADQPWLKKIQDPSLEKSLSVRLYWQKFQLDRLARSVGCDVLFVPGGSYRGGFRPFVTMSRNMLPFEHQEYQRFGFSGNTLRYVLLRQSQLATFRKASGLIFLSDYARTTIHPHLNGRNTAITTIPHGVEESFRCEPRMQESLGAYSAQRPFRLLYVSIINLYKHQWHVAEAVGQLRKEGLPIAIDFIGPAYKPALQRLQQAQNRWDPTGEFIRYVGPVPYKELPGRYHQADGFVFASSCENMPNILLEAMASGLPIACSNRGPMPEMLGDAGLYFDPENPAQIAEALRTLLTDVDLRQQIAWKAYDQAQNYSWQRCADETFAFLAQVASNSA